jgi:ribosome-binding factor A
MKKGKTDSLLRRPSSVRKEQKKAVLFKFFSSLIQQIVLDDSSLLGLFVSKVEVSADGGICYILFSTYTDKEFFDNAFPKLILYKPSMRTALAKEFQSRYTPEIRFKYDRIKDKERVIHDLLDSVKAEESKGTP